MIVSREDDEMHIERSIAVVPDPTMLSLPLSVAIVSIDMPDESISESEDLTSDKRIKELKSP